MQKKISILSNQRESTKDVLYKILIKKKKEIVYKMIRSLVIGYLKKMIYGKGQSQPIRRKLQH